MLGSLRTALTLLALISVAVPVRSQSPETLGRIEGTLTNEVTNQPIHNGSLSLRPVDPTNSKQSGPAKSYTAVSDADGRFILDQIAPGQYRLTASRPGYTPGVFTKDGSQNLRIQAAQPLKDLRFALQPFGVIAGQIVDENAEPMTEIRVSALRNSYRKGRRMHMSTGVPAAVDDQGRFRIANLAPGKYILAATPAQASSKSADEGPTYVTTYYPQARDASLAEALLLAPGAELNATIRLHKERVYRVRGKLIDASTGEAAPSRSFLRLSPPQNTPGGVEYSALVNQEGSFQFPAVLPGSYVIRPDLMDVIARLPGRTEHIGAKLFGQFPVTIEDHNLDGIVVKFRKGCSVSGIVAAEEEKLAPANPPPPPSPSTETKPANLIVHFTSERGDSEYSTTVKSDKTFAIDDLAPDRYRVSVSGLPDGNYAKSFRVENQPLRDGLLDLTFRETVELQISTSPQAASLSGTAHNKDGEAVADALVTLHPIADPSGGPVSLLQVKTGPDGRFEFKNLLPAEYQILAWEAVDINIAMNPDFYGQFESRAVRTTLDPAAQSTLSLLAIPAEATRQAEAKMP